MPISTRNSIIECSTCEAAGMTDGPSTDAIDATPNEEPMHRQMHRDGRVARLLAISERYAAQLEPGASSVDHGALFYAEAGLPA